MTKYEDGKRIEIHSGPDEFGRYVYTIFRMADYHPGHPEGEHGMRERAQVFNAPLPGWALGSDKNKREVIMKPMKTKSPMVALLYELMRDHVSAATIERILENDAGLKHWTLSNGYLGNHAKNIVDRLKSKEKRILGRRS